MAGVNRRVALENDSYDCAQREITIIDQEWYSLRDSYKAGIEALLERINTVVETLEDAACSRKIHQLLVECGQRKEQFTKLYESLNGLSTSSSMFNTTTLNDKKEQFQLMGMETDTSESCTLPTSPCLTQPSSASTEYKNSKQEPAVDSRQAQNSIQLLLIGCSGNGKSATGNSILGKNVFKINSTSSSMPNIVKGSVLVDGTQINVIDGPSIDPSGSIDTDFFSNLLAQTEKSLDLCDYAFSAILIVLKYGNRFTEQETETLRMIKALLGNDVIKKFGICVVTKGDSFEYDAAENSQVDEDLSFEGWCRTQTPEVKDLFEECFHRCVLFNNRATDETIRKTQLYQLLSMVPKNKTYSRSQFLDNQENIECLNLETQAPKVQEETYLFVSEKRTQFQNLISQSKSTDEKELTAKTTSLLKDVSDNINRLDKLSNGTPHLKQPLTHLRTLELEIKSHLRHVNDSKSTDQSFATQGTSARSTPLLNTSRPVFNDQVMNVASSNIGDKSDNSQKQILDQQCRNKFKRNIKKLQKFVTDSKFCSTF